MVKNKVKQIVDDMKSLHFVYDDWARANVRFDREQLPAFLFILPVAGAMHYKNNNFRDAPKCLFAFIDKTEFDFDGETNEAIVDRMKNEAKRFIVAVQESGHFKPIAEKIPYSVLYDQLDPNVTGVVVEMQLEEIIGDCVAQLSPQSAVNL